MHSIPCPSKSLVVGPSNLPLSGDVASLFGTQQIGSGRTIQVLPRHLFRDSIVVPLNR